MEERRDYFRFMLDRVKDVAVETGREKPQAFVKWFVDLYFSNPHDFLASDGPLDGKVDALFKLSEGRTVIHHAVNSKFTERYDYAAPIAYYDEISHFANLFLNPDKRSEYLSGTVKEELRPHYRELFRAYDDGRAELLFLTNHRLNEKRIDNPNVRILQLDDLINYLIDDIDGAMPRTNDLILAGINSVLSPDRDDTVVPTTIAFARLVDFIHYMDKDPFGLLFARNVRDAIPLSKSAANRSIRDTFKTQPREFAYSNNGITILCEKHTHDPGNKEVTLINPAGGEWLADTTQHQGCGKSVEECTRDGANN